MLGQNFHDITIFDSIYKMFPYIHATKGNTSHVTLYDIIVLSSCASCLNAQNNIVQSSL